MIPTPLPPARAPRNLPNIFKSQTALASTKVPDIVKASASATTGSVNNVSAGLTSGADEAARPRDRLHPSRLPPKAQENGPQKSEDEKSDDAGTKCEGFVRGSKTQDGDDISGSVRQKTEDGVNIALISDVLDVPDDNPSLIGFTFSNRSQYPHQVRTKQDRNGAIGTLWTKRSRRKLEQRVRSR